MDFTPKAENISVGLADNFPRPAKNRYSSFSQVNLSTFDRINYTRIAVVLGFAAGFMFSHRLWISTRFYPLIPVVHNLRPIPFPFDYIFTAVLFLSLWLIALASRPRVYIFSFAVLLVFLALFDQTRWQPWVYLYLFILLSLGCFSWKREDTQGQKNVLNACRLIVVATYFYSGLQKMNQRFAAIAVVSMLGLRANHLPLLHVWPWIMAGFEVGLAVGLLTRKYRNLAVIGGIGMHGFILFSNIVIHVWNSVVWPWNLTMMTFLVLLFWKADFSFADVLWRNPMPLQKVVLLLFGIMPLFSFFGWWDSYLSASLYSANAPEARIIVGGNVRDHLPGRVKNYTQQLPAALYALDVGKWSMEELNVPPYPAMRVYRAVGAEVCKYADNSPDVVLLMRDKDTFLAKGRQTQDTCLGTIMVNKW